MVVDSHVHIVSLGQRALPAFAIGWPVGRVGPRDADER